MELSGELFSYSLHVIIVLVVASPRIIWLNGHSAKHLCWKRFILLMRHLTLTFSEPLCVFNWLYLLSICFCPVLSPCFGSILYLSIIEIYFQVDIIKLVMALCLSHWFSLFLIAVTAATACWELFFFLGLVDLDDNRAHALGFVKLVYFHLSMDWGPWGLVVFYDIARHFRTHLRDVNVYHLLHTNWLALHFFYLLKYLIVHLPFCFSFFEFISFFSLIFSGSLILLLLALLCSLLLLLGSFLFAVYVNTESNKTKNYEGHKDASDYTRQINFGSGIRVCHIDLSHEGISPSPRWRRWGWRRRRWHQGHYVDIATSFIEKSLSIRRGSF